MFKLKLVFVKFLTKNAIVLQYKLFSFNYLVGTDSFGNLLATVVKTFKSFNGLYENKFTYYYKIV